MAVSKEFADEIAYALGVDNSDGFVTRFLTEWARWEGSKATNNPLATTQSGFGTDNFNSAGVKNYASLEDGVAATIRTLQNGRYDGIVQAMRSKDLSNIEALLPEFKTWGTGNSSGFVNWIKDGSFATAVNRPGDNTTRPTTDQPPAGVPGGPTDDDPFGIREAGRGATTPSSILEVLQNLRFEGGAPVTGLLGDVSNIPGLGKGATEGLLNSGIPQFDKRQLEGNARRSATGDEVEDYLLRGETPPDELLELLNYQLGIVPSPGGGNNDRFDLIAQLSDIYATATSVGAMSQNAAQSKLNNQIEIASKFPDLGEYRPGYEPGGAAQFSVPGFQSESFKRRQVSLGNPGAPQEAYNSSFQQLLEILGASGIEDQLNAPPEQPQVAQPPPVLNREDAVLGSDGIPIPRGVGLDPNLDRSFQDPQERTAPPQLQNPVQTGPSGGGGGNILQQTLAFLNENLTGVGGGGVGTPPQGIVTGVESFWNSLLGR